MNIESIKRKLLVKYPFFGSVVANSNFIADSLVGTAGTDGKNIYYNPDFISSISEQQQIFIFAHEICHIAFDHIFRSEGKDKELWNIATDSVINAFLKQDGLPMVEGGVDIPEAINFDAEEMYKKLLDKKNKQKQGNSEQQNGSNQNSSDSKGENSNNQNNDQNDQKQDQSNDSGGQSNEESQNAENNQQNSGSSSGTGQNESQGGQEENHDVGHDTHSLWDKAIEKKHEEEQSSSNSNGLDNEDRKEDKKSLLDKINKMFDRKKEKDKQIQNSSKKVEESEQEKKKKEDINRLTELGEKETFKQNKIERKKQLEELRKSLASQSHGHGSDTNSERRNITDIGTSEPLIDWRRLLREAVKYDIDWSYQNAGIEDGVITPYLEEFPKPETEIVLDTSGSIDENLLRNFLRECKNILQNSKVKVGCFDTKFYGFTEIKDMSDIDSLPFYGGGGTDFDVAVNAFTRRVENKIIFTDGYADMPSMSMDAIWVVFGDVNISPKGGKVIQIDEEQLDRLCNYEMYDKSSGKTR